MANYDYRIEQIKHMKTEISIDSKHTIVTTFKLAFKGDTIVYAFLYSTNHKHLYYCANPPFESKDGEYRPKVCMFENLEKLTTTYPELYAEVDQYMAKKKAKMNWKVIIEHFCHKDTCTIGMKGLDHKLLIVMWYNCVSNMYYGMIEVHINDKFAKVLGIHAGDMQFFRHLEKKYTPETLRHQRQLQDYYYTDIRLGQKIIPLSLIEAQRPFDVNYKPWRELHISSKLSDLVINRICPAFSVICTYFYIYQGDRMLFDNESQIARMDVSRSMLMVADMLIRARDVSVGDTQEITHMRELLDEPIVYSKQELIMSEVALCIIGEFMGKTLHNAIHSAIRSEMYNQYLGDIIGTPETLLKFLFEYIYAILCVNVRYGIIHSDLHLNNLNIHAIYSSASVSAIIKTAGVVAYEFPEQTFSLPSTQYYGGVIDFSRCLMRDDNENLGMQTYNAARVKCLYKTYMPGVDAPVGKFSDIFPTLTAFDPMMLCIKLRDFITEPAICKHFKPRILATNVETLSTIINTCKDWLAKPTMITEHSDYPCYKLLFSDVFAMFKQPNPEAKIIDTYTFTAPMEYSLAAYDKFPPSMRKGTKKNYNNVAADAAANIQHIESVAKDHQYL